MLLLILFAFPAHDVASLGCKANVWYQEHQSSVLVCPGIRREEKCVVKISSDERGCDYTKLV